MSEYLFTLKPLEPYFFGNERTLNYPKKKEQENIEAERTEYFIESEDVPSQTTILGMLRYLVLREHGQLSSDISKPLCQAQKDLIGEKGFSLNDHRSYGKIKKVDSVFLLHNGKECILPCPLNHNFEESKEIYKPLLMSDKVNLQLNRVLPLNFKAKEGIAVDYYISLDEKKKQIQLLKWDKIFKAHEQVGISKKMPEKAFYKRKYKMLRENYVFAFTATIHDECFGKTGSDIVTMGQKQSPFLITWVSTGKQEMKGRNEKVEHLVPNKETLEQYLKRVQREKTNLKVYYAESPVVFQTLPDCEYYISSNKTFMFKDSEKEKFKTSMSYIVKAGSVFYVSARDEDKFVSSYANKNCTDIGLNHIIKLED